MFEEGITMLNKLIQNIYLSVLGKSLSGKNLSEVSKSNNTQKIEDNNLSKINPVILPDSNSRASCLKFTQNLVHTQLNL